MNGRIMKYDDQHDLLFKDLEVRATAAPRARAVDILIRHGDWFGTVVDMAKIAPNACPPRSTISIPEQSAQRLMDDLWNAGYRPTDSNGTSGAIRAAENHIQDLRKIAFKILDVHEGQAE